MKRKRTTWWIGWITSCMLFSLSANGQTDSTKALTDSVKVSESDSVHSAAADSIYWAGQMDIVDVFKLLFKKKKLKNPSLVKKDKSIFFTVIPYPNYTIATGVAGVLTCNVAFYANKTERQRQSFFNNQVQYTQYKQFLAQSIHNVYLSHDKWELVGDWRYFNFPTFTYGLGIHTLAGDEDRLDYSYIKLYETIYRKISSNIDVGIGYALDYHWKIKDYNAEEEGDTTDLIKYGYQKKTVSSGLTLNLLHDSRDNTNDPSTGAYLNVQFRANVKAFGSISNWNGFNVDYRRYFEMPTKYWKSTLAFWCYMNFTVNGTPPYLDLPSTGSDTYNNSGRGYALGRYRGMHMIYLEAEYRFDIMRNGLVGGVVFANMQTFADWPEINFTGVQPGIGIGLRVKANKRTHTNIAADYGFGTKGSKGAAFNLNEVF